MLNQSVKIGIVQAGAVHLNLKKSLEKAVYFIEEAAKNSVELLVFGETWLSGYPAWLDHCPEMALWDHEATKEVFSQMYLSSVRVEGREIESLKKLAKKYQIIICIGINERVEQGAGSGTIYNSFLLIDSEGKIANHHRKLMPTFTEKMLYGMGDGYGLKAVDTVIGRVGGLICWEHWMPFSRQALHLSNEHFHLALWPQVHEMHQIASRQYAFEGRCFVIAVGQILEASDFPKVLTLPENLKNNPGTKVLKGGSCIIAPDGKFIMEPQWGEKEFLICEINDLDRLIKERMTLDVTGHYQRNDVFDFKVNYQRKL